MSTTKIQNNPFYVLGISCHADRKTIVAAAEERSFLIDPTICAEAQNTLVNANKRLSAELDWFPSSNPKELAEITQTIDAGDVINTDSLFSISKLNATLYNFEISREVDYFEMGYAVLDIDEQYTKLQLQEIVNAINGCRAESNFPSVQSIDVSRELSGKRESIRQIIASKMSALTEEAYVELVSMIAEKCIAEADYENGVVIDDVVDQYELRMQATIESKADEIRAHISRIKSLADDDGIADDIAPLIKRIKDWDRYAQPLQLKSMASGVPHKVSEDLGCDIRDLALYLHNEKGRTSDALILVDAMRDVFAELESLLDLFEDDSRALKGLLKGQKEAEEVLAEMDALKAKSTSVKSFATEADVFTFIEQVEALNAKVKVLDIGNETKQKVRENICYIARGTAIELHNTRHQTAYALQITEALNEMFGDIPTLARQLSSDHATLIVQLGRSTSTYSNSPSESGNSDPLFRILLCIIVIITVVVASLGKSPDKGSTAPTSEPSPSNIPGYSAKSGSNPSPATGISQAELDRMLKDIQSMENRLESMASNIEDMENDLKSLSNDLDYYETQYKITGDAFYYNCFYSTLDEYNDLYDDYLDAIDEYNSLYGKYSDAIDDYNRKIK